ncbi:MAG: NRDE family protein [Alphaproteobacteria bacterium]
MCTVVILRRPSHQWPIIVAANRDEMLDRPSRPPGRHWPERADVTAGLDELAGGSWFGLNDAGVAAMVMNRPGSLGPEPGIRSRGELVLEALDHADAVAAAAALRDIDPRSYRSFNLVVCDNRDVYWLRGEGGGHPVEVRDVPSGVSMITAYDLNDRACPRISAFLPRFRAAAAPEPDTGEWSAWMALMGERARAGGAEAGMTIVTDRGFGTVSSCLLALPAIGRTGEKPVWLFAPGRPGDAPYAPVGR